jgi:hypothetical protein
LDQAATFERVAHFLHLAAFAGRAIDPSASIRMSTAS